MLKEDNIREKRDTKSKHLIKNKIKRHSENVRILKIFYLNISLQAKIIKLFLGWNFNEILIALWNNMWREVDKNSIPVKPVCTIKPYKISGTNFFPSRNRPEKRKE